MGGFHCSSDAQRVAFDTDTREEFEAAVTFLNQSRATVTED